MGASDTKSQRLGRSAEAAFAAAVVSRGHLWNQTASGNDFGIDGTIELGQKDVLITGKLCNVQIKGTECCEIATDGFITLADIKVATAEYWYSRISPTLLVLWEEKENRFFCDW